MARRIIWSSRASDEKIEIFKFWNQHNKSKAYSRRLNRLFNEAVEILKNHPFIGRPTNIENVHVKIVLNYLIVYQVRPDEIIIIRIWDGRRDPNDMP